MEAKYFRFLKIVGVGFKARAEAEGRLLFLKLGYSHEVELSVPAAVRVFCFKNNIVCCTGIDKDRVHQFAAAVRSTSRGIQRQRDHVHRRGHKEKGGQKVEIREPKIITSGT